MKTLILVLQNGMVRQILDIFSKQISDIRVGLFSESRPEWGHIKSFTFRNYYAK